MEVSFSGEVIQENTFNKCPLSHWWIQNMCTWCLIESGRLWRPITQMVFERYSFVGGIDTVRGGKHVEYVVDQIAKR